jgi:hypothetical protein
MPMNPRLLRPTQGGFSSPDADARAYLAAVRIADGSNLEPAVAKAISDFVIGCKADGIWDAIKASCILMGARTLNGVLTPLKGAAPTSNAFVGDSTDYNRKTGLLGNASTKYIDTNRNNNADPQDSKHIAVFVTTLGTSPRAFIGMGGGSSGATNLYRLTANEIRLNSGSSNQWGTATVGLTGASRAASTGLTGRSNGTNTTITRDSQSPASGNIFVFAQNVSNIPQQPSDARIAFYSIGESIDLSPLDTRVSALFTAIGAAI